MSFTPRFKNFRKTLSFARLIKGLFPADRGYQTTCELLDLYIYRAYSFNELRYTSADEQINAFKVYQKGRLNNNTRYHSIMRVTMSSENGMRILDLYLDDFDWIIDFKTYEITF